MPPSPSPWPFLLQSTCFRRSGPGRPGSRRPASDGGVDAGPGVRPATAPPSAPRPQPTWSRALRRTSGPVRHQAAQTSKSTATAPVWSSGPQKSHQSSNLRAAPAICSSRRPRKRCAGAEGAARRGHPTGPGADEAAWAPGSGPRRPGPQRSGPQRSGPQRSRPGPRPSPRPSDRPAARHRRALRVR